LDHNGGESTHVKPPGVLCSGSIVYDTLVQPVDEIRWGTTQWISSLEYHVGGNGANTARALAVLGTPVRLLGVVGNDAPADFILGALSQAGVDTSRIRRCKEPTAATVVVINSSGDRQFLHRLGSSSYAFEEPTEFTAELCQDVSHYHFASLFVLPHLRRHGPEMLNRARNAGLTTSLDTNWDPLGKWMGTLSPLLPYVDILFMNEDEALMTTGSGDPALAASVVLNRGVGTAVMKLGRRGCAVYTADEEILSPAFDVVTKDTTGAGDCFVAGFLAARQAGASWKEAARFGNAVGALSVEKVGAAAGVLPWAETRAWIETAQPRRNITPRSQIG